MTPIVRMMLLLAFLFTVSVPVSAVDLPGTVIASQGNDVTVKFESAGTLQPAVGDILYIMERANEEGHALGVPGDWVITEVKGDIVKAKGKNLVAGHRPQVNMQAFIQISPGPVHAGEAPKALSEKMPSPIAIGKVLMTRGNHVTIQLSEGQSAVSKGDAVELSYSVDDIVIPVGKWRISAINQNGTLEAKPVEAETQPTIDMDALVFTSSPKKPESVKSKKELLKPDTLDTAKAERLKHESACSKGSADACSKLGFLYGTGKGVALDYYRAVELYRKACSGGSSMGCYNLGIMYRDGLGVAQDHRQAASFFMESCDTNYAKGCTNLGYLYANGKGVDQDYGRAIEYYKKGCDGGDGRGCGNLGWTHYQGRGTAIDQNRGQKLMEKACKMGNTWSCNKLKELGK